MKHTEPNGLAIGKGYEPFRVPEGYFSGVTDRVLERIREEEAGSARVRVIRWKPVLTWVSGAAAILIIGMLGLRAFYLLPMRESRVREDIALFVEYYGEELQEVQLARYAEQSGIDLPVNQASGMDAIIEMEPESVEEFIYETIGF